MISMLSQFWRALRMPAIYLSALGLAALLCLGTASVLVFFPVGAEPRGLPTAALTIIPGASPTPIPPTPTPTQPFDPAAGLPTPLPGQIGIGSFVQIVGTEGIALNIRLAPGLSSDVFFLAYEAEVFVVRDGPQQADGFTWWYLVTPVDEARAGWAAADYLALVDSP